MKHLKCSRLKMQFMGNFNHFVRRFVGGRWIKQVRNLLLCHVENGINCSIFTSDLTEHLPTTSAEPRPIWSYFMIEHFERLTIETVFELAKSKHEAKEFRWIVEMSDYKINFPCWKFSWIVRGIRLLTKLIYN